MQGVSWSQRVMGNIPRMSQLHSAVMCIKLFDFINI